MESWTLAKPFERARDEAAAALSVPNKRTSMTSLDAFTGLKYLLASLAKQYDEGVQPLNVVVKDPQDRCHVFLRLISAHQAICQSVKDSNGEVATGVKGQQPLLHAWFRVSWKTSSKKSKQKGISIGPEATERGDSPNTIIANLGTQVLLINLLNQNRSILSRKRGTDLPLQRTRNGLELSFLVPCYNLTADYLARYQMPHPCTGCNKEGRLLCAACDITYYCSRDCQQQHWESHAPKCTKAAAEPYLEVQYVPWRMYTKTRAQSRSSALNVTNSDDAAVHAPKPARSGPFTVFENGKKVLAKLTSSSTRKMRIIGKGLDGYVSEAQPAFRDLLKVMRKFGNGGTKIYIYAQKVDNHTVRVFHEDLPCQKMVW